MKISDDYEAKFKIWAENPKVYPMPKIVFPFKIPSQKFSSYEDFNKWKNDLLADIAKHGGVQWKK